MALLGVAPEHAELFPPWGSGPCSFMGWSRCQALDSQVQSRLACVLPFSPLRKGCLLMSKREIQRTASTRKILLWQPEETPSLSRQLLHLPERYEDCRDAGGLEHGSGFALGLGKGTWVVAELCVPHSLAHLTNDFIVTSIYPVVTDWPWCVSVSALGKACPTGYVFLKQIIYLK